MFDLDASFRGMKMTLFSLGRVQLLYIAYSYKNQKITRRNIVFSALTYESRSLLGCEIPSKFAKSMLNLGFGSFNF